MTKERTIVGTKAERMLLLAGAAGLALAAMAVACGDDSSSASSSSSSSSGTSGTSGTSGSATCAKADTAANTSAVVAAANALSAALTTEQQTKIRYDKTLANAKQWSNFPTTFVARNGVRLSDMSAEARTAAVALAQAAAGEQGAKLLKELRAADQWLVTNGKASSTDYGDGLYYFSLHGTPSASSAWMLQIAGHHLAYNFSYGSTCTSASPLFEGAEPMDWTDNGTVHAPLGAARSAMVALVGAIQGDASSKLSGSFNDLVNGPAGGMGGGGDTKYPSSLTYPTGTTGRGIAVGTMTAAQQALVKTAMEGWVKNVADPVSAALLSDYESEASLAATYVGYVGSADLSTSGSYVRIDGPRVWIEASVQGGIVYRNVVHWHTIWRDKAADYGADFVQ